MRISTRWWRPPRRSPASPATITAASSAASSPRDECGVSASEDDKAQLARIARLERALERQKAACRELESITENQTRQLFTVLEQAKRQARVIREQGASA